MSVAQGTAGRWVLISDHIKCKAHMDWKAMLMRVSKSQVQFS